MSTPLRAAVIGLGSMGANHARVLSDLPGVELVGVADADPERVAKATANRAFPGFPDSATLLAETRPEMVSVVVPTGFHETVALQVIAAGANALVEKPIAATLPSAARIAAAAEAKGVVLMVGHIERFNSAIRELKRRLDEGQGGRVLQVRARRVGPFPHRIRDVGVIHDLAPHDIDIMRYVLGDEVERVYAEAQRHIATENEDLFAGMLHFRRGALGLLDINWLTPTKERTLTVLCEKGMFVADYAEQSLAFYENYAASAKEGAIASVTEGPMTRYPINYREPLRVELEAFRDAVRDRAAAPVSARDGIAALAVAEALVQSAKLAANGHQVFGCDIDAGRVAQVNRGENPIPDEAGLDALLREVVAAGKLRATTDTMTAVSECETVLFAVAVDVDDSGRADLGSLFAAADDVARGMKPGTLCVFDTTLPVGTTRRELAPRLEAGGLRLGRDFSVAFSPERLLMGRVIEDLTKYPKVVGGVDAEGGERAAAFFRAALGSEVLVLANAETAELSKLSEGVYRDLNIALANELAQVADVFGIDISEVIAAANSQPYCHIHVPGTGVGGHCIPVYPQFLVQGPGPSELAALGRRVNDEMPGYAAARVEELLGGLGGKRILILGLTFRPDVAVTPHTNAVDLLREFSARGAIVRGHDALLSEAGVRVLGFEPAPEPLGGYDAAVLHAYHRAYRDLDWRAIAPLLVDARNALDRAAIEAGGVRYMGIGRPVSPD